MHKEFTQKKILLFSPEFFGYGKAIAEKLKFYGAEVSFFDERPGNDFLTKVFIRLNKSLLKHKTKNYYDNIIVSLAENYYDYVLFLNAEAISKKELEKLKKTQLKAKFMLYMWDSIKNKKNTKSLITYFDIKYTFDKNDSKDLKNLNFNFRPLFYLDDFKTINSSIKKTSDLLFVGTIHSDRYNLLMLIKKWITENNLTFDFFMFFQSKKLYYFNKFFNKTFVGAKYSDFEYTPLNTKKLIKKIEQTNVVLDIQHPKQTGLTIRSIEMIGARTKMITTNENIKNYDFYDPSNILVIKRGGQMNINKDFFKTNYKPINQEISYKYSIDGWLKEVFNFKE